MRKKLLLGNWKMNKTISETKEFAKSIDTLVELAKEKDIDIGVAPVYLSLQTLKELVPETFIVSAQNCHFKDSGAYTGEISIPMLKEIGIPFEEVIDRLIEKIQTYENVYSDEYGEMVKILGNRILSISDAQNSTAVQRMRHIHTLIEEVKELQEEVATLRQQVAEKDGLIKQLKGSRRTNLFHDDLTDDFLHVYAEVDITQLGQKVKEMSNDCNTVKGAVFTLKSQLETIINEATKTTKSALAAMQRKNEQMEKKIKEEKAVRSFAGTTIPFKS